MFKIFCNKKNKLWFILIIEYNPINEEKNEAKLCIDTKRLQDLSVVKRKQTAELVSNVLVL